MEPHVLSKPPEREAPGRGSIGHLQYMYGGAYKSLPSSHERSASSPVVRLSFRLTDMRAPKKNVHDIHFEHRDISREVSDVNDGVADMLSIYHRFSKVPSVGLQGSLSKSKLFGHLSENVACNATT